MHRQTFNVGDIVYVDNKMQKGYSYRLVAERGAPTANFDPAFTPNAMLRLGVFGSVYMRDCLNEYPAEMSNGMRCQYSHNTQQAEMNAFKVLSGDNLAFWRAAGWIDPQDPRGWFEWYCRYWLGRRTQDDYRQMARWRMFAPRHAGTIRAFGKRDITVRQKTRQSLLHWASDPVPDFTCLPGECIAQKTFRVIEEEG